MKIKEFKNLKISYREGTVDEEVLVYSFENDVYFIPEYNPKPDDVIIDLGAHIGTFSILAASKLKRGKIYAIEPCKESFEYLLKNVALNKFSNISSSNLALTDFKGTTKLYYDINSGNWGHSIVKKFSEQGEEVQTDTLTNFMQDNNILQCDYMKLNCEGAEFKIILSTPKEILRRVKLMFILYHLDLVENYSEKDLMKYLHKCGFSTTIRNKSDTRGWIIAHLYRGPMHSLYLRLRFVYFSYLKMIKYSKYFINKLIRQ